MGSLTKHVGNGIISLVISVVVTVVMAEEENGPWNLGEVATAVGISAFLSGFFTSYFAE